MMPLRLPPRFTCQCAIVVTSPRNALPLGRADTEPVENFGQTSRMHARWQFAGVRQRWYGHLALLYLRRATLAVSGHGLLFRIVVSAR
jgi:hypothetical protein